MSFPFDFSDPLAPRPVMDGEEAAALGPENIKMVPTPFDVTGEEPQPILDYARILQLDRENLPAGVAFLPDAAKFMTEVLADPSRSILGEEQEAWLKDELAQSKDAGVPWQVIGQQLLVGRVPMPDFSAQLKPVPDTLWTEERVGFFNMGAAFGLPFNLDAWDGYVASRDRFAEDILENANNTLVLSGDTHNAWAFNLQKNLGDAPYAVELATPGVTSPGMDGGLPIDLDFAKQQIRAVSPELAYLNNRERGYMTVTLTPETATAAWYFIDDILSREFTVTCETALQTTATDAPGVPPLREVACD
jgi:alkaline phosphatase D